MNLSGFNPSVTIISYRYSSLSQISTLRGLGVYPLSNQNGIKWSDFFCIYMKIDVVIEWCIIFCLDYKHFSNIFTNAKVHYFKRRFINKLTKTKCYYSSCLDPHRQSDLILLEDFFFMSNCGFSNREISLPHYA